MEGNKNNELIKGSKKTPIKKTYCKEEEKMHTNLHLNQRRNRKRVAPYDHENNIFLIDRVPPPPTTHDEVSDSVNKVVRRFKPGVRVCYAKILEYASV